MSSRKEKIINEKKENEKKIAELQGNKTYLEEIIDDQKHKLIKAKFVRNLKIFGYLLKFTGPIVLLSGTVIGVGATLNAGLPIYKDSVKYIKKYSLQMNIDGNIEAKEDYIEYQGFGNEISPENNFLKIYSPWEKVEIGFQRYIREYNIQAEDDLDLYYFLLRQDGKYVFDKYNLNYKEIAEFRSTIDNLSNNDYLIECNISLIDKDDYISKKENDSKNNIVSIIELLLIAIFSGVIAKTRKFDLKKEIDENIEQYRIERTCLTSYKDELKEIDKKILMLTKDKNEK